MPGYALTGRVNNAYVYRVGQPGQLVTLKGHSDGINDASLSPDSTLIATTTNDGDGPECSATTEPNCDNSTRVWDIDQSSPLLTLINEGGSRVDFSTNGTSLLVNDFFINAKGDLQAIFPYETLSCIVCGGFGRLVPLAQHAELRGFTAQERVRFLPS